MTDNQETPPSILAPSASLESPQFAKAEYASTPSGDRCKICGNLINMQYYRVNGNMACGTCAQQAQAGQPVDTHVAFGRALLFGIGGALLGLALYSTVEIVTSFTIGYLALAVGWLVAKAMMAGSKGIGGTRYQVVAVLLTYFAISMSAVPVGISYVISHRGARTAQTQSEASMDDSSTANADSSQTSDSSAASSGSAPRRQQKSTGQLIGSLLFFGIASPFLELASPGSGLIGLVILFVGLSIAFRMTKARPLQVDGPFAATA